MSKYALWFFIATVSVSLTSVLSPLWHEAQSDTVSEIPKTQKSQKLGLGESPSAKKRVSRECRGGETPYQSGIASWYGEYFHGRTMANGKPYDMHAYTVAHRTLPMGTKLCIVNEVNGRGVRATVTDRGPYVEPRIIDLSMRIATDLGIGLGDVKIFLL